jgi:HAMP domain-containing protein
LPRQVVKPLISLREAVDHAAKGDGAIDLEIEGHGEVADLALSVRNLIVQLRQNA